MDVEKLIEEVRQFPVLYDQSSDKYRNCDYKEKVWKTIANNLQVEVDECKKKWNSVRDQLRRTLQKRKMKSGQAALQIRKYKYEDVLTYLVPHLGEREGLSNVPKPQDTEDNEHESVEDNQKDSIEETCQQQPVHEEPKTEGNKYKFVKPKAHKRRVPFTEETYQDSPSRQLMAYILSEKQAEKNMLSRQDPVDAFLGGIAPTLKSLNPQLLNEAKGRIFAVVQEMELKQIQLNASMQSQMSTYVTFSSSSSEQSSSIPYVSPCDETRIPNEPLYFNLENL